MLLLLLLLLLHGEIVIVVWRSYCCCINRLLLDGGMVESFFLCRVNYYIWVIILELKIKASFRMVVIMTFNQ